jgi:hypothetical protein
MEERPLWMDNAQIAYDGDVSQVKSGMSNQAISSWHHSLRWDDDVEEWLGDISGQRQARQRGRSGVTERGLGRDGEAGGLAANLERVGESGWDADPVEWVPELRRAQHAMRNAELDRFRDAERA